MILPAKVWFKDRGVHVFMAFLQKKIYFFVFYV